jgi:DNA-directed RNA polymerase subunit RPC12/RpoP
MPIRFRCVYCNQLLGISRRKAGTVVRCTNCGGQIIVPEADPAAAVVGGATGGERMPTRKETLPLGTNLLEHSDFDVLLKPPAGESPRHADAQPTSSVSSGEAFTIPERAANFLPRKTRSVIPAGAAIGMAVGMLLVGLMVGYFVGRSLSG